MFRTGLPVMIVFLSACAQTASGADGSEALELFANPNLPAEGEEVVLTVRLNRVGATPESIRVEVKAADGVKAMSEALTLVPKEDCAVGSARWTAGKNGMYSVAASSGSGFSARMDLPVICKERQLDFAWYSYRPWIRWATVFTSCGENEVPDLRLRGIKALKWRGAFRKPKDRVYPPVEETRRRAREYYQVPEGFPFDGYGIDEFGGYPQTESEKHNYAWLRGLRDAREDMPKDFYVAGWHCGGVRDEAVGLYKDALDLLLIESYVFHWIPKELGTENIYEDLRNRLIAPRGADSFVRCYRARCKALLSLDITGGKETTMPDLGEFEQVVRQIKRMCPEMRGIGFFNGSATHEVVERFAHDMCLKYYIKPVVTFQPQSLWLKETDAGLELVAAVSNVGGMDSGAVTVRVKVGGQVVATRRIESVPAGHDRRNNRAFVRVEWSPPEAGTYRIEAEIVDSDNATVLGPVVREERFCKP